MSSCQYFTLLMEQIKHALSVRSRTKESLHDILRSTVAPGVVMHEVGASLLQLQADGLVSMKGLQYAISR